MVRYVGPIIVQRSIFRQLHFSLSKKVLAASDGMRAKKKQSDQFSKKEWMPLADSSDLSRADHTDGLQFPVLAVLLALRIIRK